MQGALPPCCLPLELLHLLQDPQGIRLWSWQQQSLWTGEDYNNNNNNTNTFLFQEFPDLAKEKSEMERVVEMGVGESDRTLANQIARSDITKLYLMSELLLLLLLLLLSSSSHSTKLSPGYYWTILAMTTVGNLPHPTTKVRFVF